MTRRMQMRHSSAILVAGLALVAAIGGTAIAGPTAKDSNTAKDAKKALKFAKKNKKALKNFESTPGPQGEQGVSGAQGPNGDKGDQGDPGSLTGPAGGDLTGSYPDPDIAADAVGTPEIAGSAVTSGKIAADAVNSNKVTDDSLTGSDIDESSLSGVAPSGAAGGDLIGAYPNPVIAVNAVGAAQIALEAVGSSEIADDSVGAAEIATNAVHADEFGPLILRTGTGLIVNGGTGQDGIYVVGTATASCLAGELLLSGSGEWTDEIDGDELAIQEVVYDVGLTVTVKGMSDVGADRTLRARALCLRTAPS